MRGCTLSIGSGGGAPHRKGLWSGRTDRYAEGSLVPKGHRPHRQGSEAAAALHVVIIHEAPAANGMVDRLALAELKAKLQAGTT